jgi:quinol monooxygenase YgiN
MKLHFMVPLALSAVVLSIIACSTSAYSAEAQVITYLEINPASLKQGVSLTKHYVHDTQTEPGNKQAVALQEIGRPERLALMESWADHEAFERHEQASHTLMFRRQFKAHSRAPPDLRVTHALSDEHSTPGQDRKAVYVVTHVDVPTPKREEAEVLLSEMVARARTASGHIRYDVYQQNDPRMNHFTLFAIWTSTTAFEAQVSDEASLHFRESLGPLLGALYDERIYHVVQ